MSGFHDYGKGVLKYVTTNLFDGNIWSFTNNFSIRNTKFLRPFTGMADVMAEEVAHSSIQMMGMVKLQGV